MLELKYPLSGGSRTLYLQICDLVERHYMAMSDYVYTQQHRQKSVANLSLIHISEPTRPY